MIVHVMMSLFRIIFWYLLPVWVTGLQITTNAVECMLYQRGAGSQAQTNSYTACLNCVQGCTQPPSSPAWIHQCLPCLFLSLYSVGVHSQQYPQARHMPEVQQKPYNHCGSGRLLQYWPGSASTEQPLRNLQGNTSLWQQQWSHTSEGVKILIGTFYHNKMHKRKHKMLEGRWFNDWMQWNQNSYIHSGRLASLKNLILETPRLRLLGQLIYHFQMI